jgi:hypothetical protein
MGPLFSFGLVLLLVIPYALIVLVVMRQLRPCELAVQRTIGFLAGNWIGSLAALALFWIFVGQETLTSSWQVIGFLMGTGICSLTCGVYLAWRVGKAGGVVQAVFANMGKQGN